MLYNKEVPGSEHPFYRMGFIVVAPIESQEDKITGNGANRATFRLLKVKNILFNNFLCYVIQYCL